LGLGPPVEVALARRPGTNLAIGVADPVSGQGMVASCVVSAARAAPPGSSVHVVDLMPLEDGFAAAMAALAGHAPVRIGRRRNLAEVIDAVRNQLVNRLARPGDQAPPSLFAINGFVPPGPGGDGSPAELVRHLAQIVHDGPAVGIHTVLWGDGDDIAEVIGAELWSSFALRVLGPTDPARSRALIDSAAAGDLAPNQAVLYDEPSARMTRFRPFALPRADWVGSLGNGSAARQASTVEPPVGAARA
jgi:hypothetical protein